MSTNASSLFVACMLALGLAPPAFAQHPKLQRLHRALPADSFTGSTFATGDVDGDGDADLVIGRWAPFSPSKVWLNDGNGVFSELSGAWTSSARATALALGDVDGDGDLDIVEGSDGPDGLYLNDGSGRFYDVSYQLPPSLGETTDVALFDADVDGDLDLAFARGDGKSRLVLNLGGGAFAEAPAGILDDPGPTVAFAIGDVDGDGDDDVLIGSHSHFGSFPPRLVRNQGGTFVEVPFPSTLLSADGAVALFDADGDQDLDAVVGLATGSELLLNDGTGAFTAAGLLPPSPQARSFDAVRSLVAGDVDGDGDLDLAAGYFPGTFSAVSVLYLNDGTGGFTLSPGFPDDLLRYGELALVDVDGDQDLDVICDAQVLVLNDGNGAFVRTDALEADHKFLYETIRIAIADADGDGDVDLFASGSGVWLNDHGTFVQSASAPPLSGQVVDVGDLDGDGDVDVLGGPDRMLLGDGAGGFVDASTTLPFVPILKSYTDVDLGDLDGDGDLDALFSAEEGGGLLLRNMGGAIFLDDSGVLPAFGPEAEQLFADVDLDGDLDLLRGREHALYRNDGLGLFSLWVGALPATSDETWTMDAGDVDGDGDVDLIWGFGGFTHDRLYKNSGGGTFLDATPAGLLFVAEPTASLRLADIDGDGDLDLYQGLAPGYLTYVDPVSGLPVLETVTGGADRVYLNSGQGDLVLADGMVAPHNGWTSDVEVADVDGDGDMDVLAAGGGWFSLSGGLLRNTTRHVACRTLPRIGKPLEMDVYGPPLSPWYLAASANAASVSLGALGTLGIDPTTLIVAVFGAFDSGGRATASFAVPVAPTLVGASAYWQGLVGSLQPRFTNVERTAFTDL